METRSKAIIDVRELGDRGAVVWRFEIGSGIEVSPAVSASGVSVLGTNDNLEYDSDTGGTVDSDPALAADGTLLIGSETGDVYAIGAT